MAFNLSAVLRFGTKGLQGNLAKANKEFNSLKKNMDTARQRAGNVGRGMRNVGIAGTAMTAGVTMAVKSYMDFQKQMDSVAAKMQPTKAEYIAMADLSKKLGAQTIFTGKQAAEGLEFLALAGFKAKDAMGVLPTLLHTAGAGALDLGKASDIITDSMSAMLPVMTKYGDKTKQASALADMLSLAQASTNTNIEQLGEAITYGGGAMANLQIPLNQIIGSMGALADAGIKGSSGGTSLVNMMGKLAKPSKKATEVMEEMGISMEDIKKPGKDGKMVLKDMSQIMKVFADAIDKNPDMLNKSGVAMEIFGKRGQKAFFALQNKGVKELDKLFNKLDKSKGASKRMYDTMTDNIFGAWESFKSATSGITLNMGQMFSEMFNIKGVLQKITDPLSKFSLALQNAMKPAEQWSPMAKKMMKTPIGQFALGVAEGFKEVKKTIKDLIIEGKKMLGLNSKSGTDFKNLGKTITKFAVALALVGPIIIALGGAFLFLTPIIMGVTSAVGLLGSAFAIAKNIAFIFGRGIMMLGGVMRGLVTMLRLDIAVSKLWAMNKWVMTTAVKGFVIASKFMIRMVRLDVLWTKISMGAKTAYNVVTKLMGTGLTWLAGKIMATSVAQKAASMWTAIMTAKTWLLNSALFANPIGLIIAGIAGLIAIGVLLWKNWDTVSKKAMEIWDRLGKWKIAIVALTGPIGWLIGAGVALYKHWDKVVGVFSKVYSWIKKIANSGLEKIGKIAGFLGFGGDETEKKGPEVKKKEKGGISSWFGFGGDDTEEKEATKTTKTAKVIPFPTEKRQADIALAETKTAGMGEGAEKLKQEHLQATKIAVGSPNVNVGSPNVNVAQPEFNFEVSNTLDGDKIHTMIKKIERKGKMHSGSQVKDSALDPNVQVGY